MKQGMTRDHLCSISVTLAMISMFLYLRNTEPTGLLRHDDVLYWATMITLPCNTGCGTRTGLLQSLPRAWCLTRIHSETKIAKLSSGSHQMRLLTVRYQVYPWSLLLEIFIPSMSCLKSQQLLMLPHNHKITCSSTI